MRVAREEREARARSFGVVVVGGGPAGAAAAITLARAGREVALFDRARFPRDKCCGDGLTTSALRRLDALGLRPGDVPSWQIVDDVVVRSASGRTVRFPLPRAATAQFGAVARRSELDAALLDVAREAGVHVFDGHRVTGVVPGPDVVTLEVDGFGRAEGRFVVAADGMWSAVRKLLGEHEGGHGQGHEKERYLGEWHALRQYYASVTGPAATDLIVWFEPELLPGYAWSFPLPGNGANVGLAIQRGRKVATKDMGRVWSELLARPHIAEALGPDAHPEAPHKAWPIPALIHRSTLTGGGGRVLFVGDAARASDPMTGEGIGQALETGALAAAAIEASGPGAPASAARHYERSVRAGLAADSRFAVWLAGGLERHRVNRFTIRAAGATPFTRRMFARWLFEDVPRAVLLTPSRWGPRILRAEGAFEETRPQGRGVPTSTGGSGGRAPGGSPGCRW
jgi:geranylgeranyl reductase family protein